MYKIYENCPTLHNHMVTLRLIKDEDALELLNCYSDVNAVPLFNSDNCNGNTFYNTTLEGMKQAVEAWKFCYETKQFVRMTIILNSTQEIIGTVEMFNRGVAPYYGVHGILRLDLMSKYENEDVLRAILILANNNFYKEFGVEWIVTKAIEAAGVRRTVLEELGYIPMNNFAGKDYYERMKDEI